MKPFNDPTGFLDMCKNRISLIIKNEGVGFNKPRRAPATRDIWELHGHYQSHAETPKRVHRVLPLVTTHLHEYWLSTQLAFIFSRGEYWLDWISMSIFEGDKSDQIKNAIIRAEWAVNGPEQRTDHAQPHWHVYASWPDNPHEASRLNVERESGRSPMSGVEEFASSGTFSTSSKVEKIHFAMASQWQHKGSGAHIEEFAIEKVLNWIEGCLSYTVAQLIYLD